MVISMIRGQGEPVSSYYC